MKVGDLVKDNHPSRGMGPDRIGVIICKAHSPRYDGVLNKAFKVLWRDGTIGNNIWDYDLRLVKSP